MDLSLVVEEAQGDCSPVPQRLAQTLTTSSWVLEALVRLLGLMVRAAVPRRLSVSARPAAAVVAVSKVLV